MGEVRAYIVQRGASAAPASAQMLTPVTVAEALAARGHADCYVWFDLSAPTADDFAPLAAPLGLHPLAVEDALDDDQVPKVEEFGTNLFLLVNRWRQLPDGLLRSEEFDFFLGRDYLVSSHGAEGRTGPTSDELARQAERYRTVLANGPDRLLHALIDGLVDEQLPVIESLEDRLDAIEEELLAGRSRFDIKPVIALRRQLLSLRKSLVYEREVVSRLARNETPYISRDAAYGFRDIQDHLVKFFEMVELCRELVASITEVHLSAVSNQMALVGNQTNFVMRRLTMITTIFMPLTLISGIGGMSEYSAMTGGPANYAISYPLFLVAMVGVAYLSYRGLRWFDRLDRGQPPAPLR